MSEMFMNPKNIPQINQPPKILPAKPELSQIKQSIGSLFNPIKNFFEENPEVINPNDIDYEITRLSSAALNIKKALGDDDQPKFNLII